MRSMVLSRASRPLRLLLAVALLASGAARGWCFMPGMQGAGPRGTHDCCKKGWVAAQPACCLESQAREAQATAGSRTALTASPAATGLSLPAKRCVLLQHVQPYPEEYHSPPGRPVLRI